jgi:hypothetical protein
LNFSVTGANDYYCRTWCLDLCGARNPPASYPTGILTPHA